MLGRLKFELDELVEEMLSYIPEEMFIRNDTTFLDPAMGGGQFVRVIEQTLRSYGHSDSNIKNRVFGFESNRMRINFAVNKNNLVGTYAKGNSMDSTNQFDVVIGNPPFNISSSSEKTIAGTSGNTTFYKKFIDKFFSLRKEGGSVVMVVQRNGIKHAIENHSVTYMGQDTSKFWDYTCGYFIANSDDNSQIDITQDPIIRKCYKINQSRRFSSATGGSYKVHKDNGLYNNDGNGVYGLVNTPTAKDGEIYAWITCRTVPAGPKLVFKGLESKMSYFCTELPHHVGSGCTLYFDSIEDAEKARLMILHNPLIKYLHKKLNEKAKGFVFRYLPDFDYNQIITGKEIPDEFGLTNDEKKLLL